VAPILRLSGIRKQYGAVEALSDVDFHVDPGEVVALVGDNGAGKSTLIKVIAGVAPADSGTVEFAGRPVSLQHPHDATRLGIATVYQDLALCDNLDLAGNLFLGRELLAGRPWCYLRLTNKVEMARRARDLLATLRVEIRDVRVEVASLSGGQRQAVAIARSLLGNPQVVLLDEPTAALGVAQTAQVLELITELKRQGHAVVVISHNLADVFDVADRVTVLRMGRNAGDFPIADTTREQVIAAITGLDGRPSSKTTQPTGDQP
jgi:D-xylose transport system ATP-binding protein